MKYIPFYPETVPVTFDLQSEIEKELCKSKDGISEFTFTNLYLFRTKYNYRICKTSDGTLLVLGENDGNSFFFSVNRLPEKEVVLELFSNGRSWKLLSLPLANENAETLVSWGITASEDRNNSDYLYLRSDLAELKGKQFHKKKNLVNAFLAAYQHEVKPLDASTAADALEVLERWNADHPAPGDFIQAKEALENIDRLHLSGWVVYVDGKPAGWSLGELIADGSMFCVHFEKGIAGIKGIYQFVNMITAQNLPETVLHVNREQDLGDEGMRQAKMTYRPCGFVVKYSAVLSKM